MAASHDYAELGVLADTTIWLAMSFLIFGGVLWKFVKPALMKGLDTRIDKIRKDIKHAENLRIEAQELLAQYQRKQRDAEKQARHILEQAKENAAQIRKMAEKDLRETIRRKETQLSERIERMKTAALADIQAYAAKLAIQATEEIISGHMDSAASSRLIDDGIKEVRSVRF